ncbi:GIY-YIG nuclease family protein [Nocardia sp. NPDC019255]|uniref:GIY-YIG nuclease family protein n=1 Tax=Nocardia sp. NPDC019255 TaxID=3154591 RepID=UPI0033EB434B
MAKSKVRPMYPVDINAPDLPQPATCVWDECRNPRHEGMPICFVHAYLVYRDIDRLLADGEPKPEKRKAHVVYYVMVGPTTVKIGTSSDLLMRLKQLRTDVQYVIALEQGSFKLEAERHRQFAEERIGRREDFKVSPRLEEHIRNLQATTYSDELLEMYRCTATRLASLPPSERCA